MAERTTGAPRASLDDRSTGELVKQLTAQTSALVRQEIRLAQAELREKGRHAGIGAGMLGSGGIVGLYAFGAVVAGIVLLLATAIAPWVAALVVGAVLAAIAGVLALAGRRQVRSATPPAPQEAMEGVRLDLETLKGSTHR